MPKSWEDTVGQHRTATRSAVLDAAAAMIAERGLAAITMSDIAQQAGIGRATLYKHFPDVDAVVTAWHQRQVARHLAQLTDVRSRPGTAVERLEAVLTTWAHIVRESRSHHDSPLAALLHRDTRVEQAQQQLRGLVRDLIADGAAAGDLRTDTPPDELAAYGLHALTAAAGLTSAEATRRLVVLTLVAMRPTEQSDREPR